MGRRKPQTIDTIAKAIAGDVIGASKQTKPARQPTADRPAALTPRQARAAARKAARVKVPPTQADASGTPAVPLPTVHTAPTAAQQIPDTHAPTPAAIVADLATLPSPTAPHGAPQSPAADLANATAATTARAALAREAIALRIRGATDTDIAQALGIRPSQVMTLLLDEGRRHAAADAARRAVMTQVVYERQETATAAILRAIDAAESADDYAEVVKGAKALLEAAKQSAALHGIGGSTTETRQAQTTRIIYRVPSNERLQHPGIQTLDVDPVTGDVIPAPAAPAPHATEAYAETVTVTTTRTTRTTADAQPSGDSGEFDVIPEDPAPFVPAPSIITATLNHSAAGAPPPPPPKPQPLVRLNLPQRTPARSPK